MCVLVRVVMKNLRGGRRVTGECRSNEPKGAQGSRW